MVRYDYHQIRQAQACLALSILLGVCGVVWVPCTLSSGYVLLPLLLCILPALAALIAALSNYQALYFGNRIRSEFRKCCLGTGLGEKFQTHGVPEWKHYRLIDLFRADGLHHKDNVPSLRGLSGNFEQWTALILPLYGQTVDDFTKQAKAFELAHNVPFVNFERGKSGGIVIRAGRAMVPSMAGYYDSPVVSADGRELLHPRELLRAVPVAYKMDDERFTLPIEGSHVLIAGRTGAGKGSWVWSIILGLAPAYDVGLVRFWAIDPKWVELSSAKFWFAEYACKEADIVELLERAVEDMFQRLAAMQGHTRKFTPSVETPLNVIVIDELGYVSSLMADKKLQDRAHKAVKTLLTQGRAPGYAVVGCAQDPRKETLPFRDQFPLRVALGLDDAGMIDLALGNGMREKGAACDQLPQGDEGAGVGYVVSEETMQPVQVRAPWCSDEMILDVWAQTAVCKRGGQQAAIEAHELPQLEFEQGYPPQLGFDGQPLDQSFDHNGE